ncbi:hypothetical protein ACKGJO_05260 [Gracilimonas sp. Q87]|uniref:hypothetical protein n=1 Tax=Gracilimonas sp. Q87 TaxID=3384766 RepID=UPI0039843C60
MDYRTFLKNKFETVVENLSNNTGKLAYLSLTSKPEGPIRDEYAWLLQEELQSSTDNLISAREYSRYDLAVLKIPENSEIKNEEEVKHIIEFKVGSAASFRGGLQQADKFVNRVVSDFQKAYENDIDLNKITSAFIAVEPLQEIDNNQRSYIKYAARSNMLRKKVNSADEVEFEISEKMISKFKERKEIDFIDHIASTTAAFKNIKVRLHLIILGAFKQHFKA